MYGGIWASYRHSLQSSDQASPYVAHQLGELDPVLRPLLVHPSDGKHRPGECLHLFHHRRLDMYLPLRQPLDLLAIIINTLPQRRNLLRLRRLVRCRRPRLQSLQLLRIPGDALLQTRTGIARKPLMPIKELAHTHKSIPQRLEILKYMLIGRPALLRQQIPRRSVCPARCIEPVVEKGTIIRVQGVGGFGQVGETRERIGYPLVVLSYAFVPLVEAVDEVAEGNIVLCGFANAGADSREELGEVWGESLSEDRGER